MERRMARQSIPVSADLSLVAACAFWAAGTIVSKALLVSVPPVLFLIVQLAPSAILLCTITLLLRLRLPRGRLLLAVLLLGALNPGLSYTLSMLGLVTTPASIATLLWAAEPIMIIALAAAFLGERLSLVLLVLAFAAAIGVVFASGAANAVAAPTIGIVLVLLGVACCAVYTVASRMIVESYDALAIVALQQAAGLAWALAIWPLELKTSPVTAIASLNLTELAGGIVSGLMYYAAAFWFYLRALGQMPAIRAGLGFNLIPVFGIALAAIFLGERLTSLQWFGALLILASVTAIQRSSLTPAPAPRVR
jgi:drug/metabolite transporter (DMT)-like permease